MFHFYINIIYTQRISSNSGRRHFYSHPLHLGFFGLLNKYHHRASVADDQRRLLPFLLVLCCVTEGNFGLGARLA